MIKKAKMLLITLCLVSLVVSLGACGYKGQVRQDVAEYLDNITTSRISQLQQDYEEYSNEASKKDAYEDRLTYLESCLVDFTGYWCRRSGTNLEAYPSEAEMGYEGHGVKRPELGEHTAGERWLGDDSLSNILTMAKDLGYDPCVEYLGPLLIHMSPREPVQGRPVERRQVIRGLPGELVDIAEVHSAHNEIPTVQEKLAWAKVYEQRLVQLPQHISELEYLCAVWLAHHEQWEVLEYGENKYCVKGYGLGYSQDPCLGSWYYDTTGGDIQPSDKWARALLKKIELHQD